MLAHNLIIMSLKQFDVCAQRCTAAARHGHYLQTEQCCSCQQFCAVHGVIIASLTTSVGHCDQHNVHDSIHRAGHIRRCTMWRVSTVASQTHAGPFSLQVQHLCLSYGCVPMQLPQRHHNTCTKISIDICFQSFSDHCDMSEAQLHQHQ